jgi:LAO/AO transport system kinase
VRWSGLAFTLAARRDSATLDAAGELTARRADQQVQWMWSTVRDRLMDRLRDDPAIRAEIPPLEAAVRTGALTATLAAEAVLTRMGTTSPTTDGY